MPKLVSYLYTQTNCGCDGIEKKANALVATGHSYQTSLARKPPDEVVARVIDGMMSEAAASQ